MIKLIILDRDGVINHDRDDFVKSVSEWQPIDGSLEAIAALNQAGYTVAVASNQSGLGRRLFSAADLTAMHNKMHQLLALVGGRVDDIQFCPHTPEQQCACRKPKPGLYQKIATHFGVSLVGIPVIGDSLRDLQAAEAVGATPILVRTGKGEKTFAGGGLPAGTAIFADLAAAVAALISRAKQPMGAI